MKKKDKATDTSMPEHPVGSTLPPGFEDMKPERIGVDVQFADGATVTVICSSDVVSIEVRRL